MGNIEGLVLGGQVDWPTRVCARRNVRGNLQRATEGGRYTAEAALGSYGAIKCRLHLAARSESAGLHRCTPHVQLMLRGRMAQCGRLASSAVPNTAEMLLDMLNPCIIHTMMPYPQSSAKNDCYDTACNLHRTRQPHGSIVEQ
jgi:hypothetical protein